MEPLTETEKAYLAGFFDGEGCITICKSAVGGSSTQYHRLVIVFAQTNEGMLKRWQIRTGLGGVYHLKRRNQSDNWTPSYAWRIEHGQAETILQLMLPYLDIKAEEARIALLFRSTMKIRPSRQAIVSHTILALRDKYMQMLKDKKTRNGWRPDRIMSPDVEQETEEPLQPALF